MIQGDFDGMGNNMPMDINQNQGGKHQVASTGLERTYVSIMGGGGGGTTE